MMWQMKILPPNRTDATVYMRKLFLQTELEILNVINRKRAAGHVDYAEVAALERVQQILQSMIDKSWSYVPTMIEKIFYHSDKDASGYANAKRMTGTFSAPQIAIIQQLTDNLLGEITEASETVYKSVQKVYTIARMEADPFREIALKQVLRQEAAGTPWVNSSQAMIQEMQNKGITAFVDKAGRKWTLQNYGNMAVRTTAHQAEVAALLTADDHDLWQIVKIGSTCKVCAALEGRVYSKSGMNSDYPPLSLAFGKVDSDGSDDLTNTYLNIHPNCLHSLVKYTTIGKTEKQIQKVKDFSDPEKNPIDRDPRTKKQIKAYREKERNRRRLLADMRQHREYRSLLGNNIPEDFAKFQKMKYTDEERWSYVKGLKAYLNKYPFSNKKFYDACEELKNLGIKKGMLLPPVTKQAFILPEGKHDPYHIMHRMRERNIADDDIRNYMKNAKCMFVQWGGKRQLFCSAQGCSVVVNSGEDWIYKTAWKREDYDDETVKILEVLKKHGI